jgi:pimeloyl-ACP methyl ester carboxylesterase
MHDDRSDDGFYRAQRDAFRSVGLVSVVWDKAGNGCSEGQYEHGTPIMARATEVLAAIEALKQRTEIDPRRIGLWGISQGGWVAPMAAVRSADVAFLILVSSPGRDAVSQLEYQALNALRTSGVNETALHSVAATLERALAIMRAGGSHKEFVAAVEPLQQYPVLRELGITEGTAERYRAWQSATEFVYRPDTALRELKQPTLAIFGDHDVLVDWRESSAIYRESFNRENNRDLTIKVFRGADHRLYSVDRKNSEPRRSPFVDGYFDTMIDWLRVRKFAQGSVKVR